MVKKAEAFRAYQELKSDTERVWEASLPSEYWEYRRKWEEQPNKLIYGDFPLHIGIEITTHCNIDCSFCIRTIEKNENNWRPEKHMELSLVMKIIDEGASNGLCGLNLNMIGEPLMHPDLVGMVRYAKKKGIIDVMFHTNGTLLNEQRAKQLIEAGLDKIIFSIDGEGKESYEKVRIGADYEKTIENLRRLAQLRRDMQSLVPRIRVTMIKFKSTTDEKIKQFYETWGAIADTISIQEFCEPQEHDPEKNFTYRTGYDPDFICPQIWHRLHIGIDGTVIPCCMDYHLEMKLGNIHHDRLKDIWHGEKLKKIREMHREGKYQKLPVCKKCGLAKV